MNKTLYGKLRGQLAENGITQTELANELNINMATLSKKMNGISPWQLHETYYLISKFPSLTIEDFIKA